MGRGAVRIFEAQGNNRIFLNLNRENPKIEVSEIFLFFLKVVIQL